MIHLNRGIRCRSPSHSTKLVAVNVFLNVFIHHVQEYRLQCFEAIGVREIGLTPFSIVFGEFIFGTGITFADFHVSGIIPSRNELSKIAVKAPARI